MNINDKGYFADITFKKLGCYWHGKDKSPSFYQTIKKENTVISYSYEGHYNIGDLILVTEGHTVLALALVESNPIDILSNKELVKSLKKDKVDEFEEIAFYEVSFYELPKKERFKYPLTQGLATVQDENIKRLATQAWLNGLDKRIMRLTWNANSWEYPSVHFWDKKHQGRTDVAHEKQYGYGHEEWLFNERFRIDGYQYGYIRGVHRLSEDVEFLDQITLYTIRDDGQRLLVGNLFNVEIIEDYEEEQDKIEVFLEKYKSEMLDELKDVNADYKHYNKEYLVPNVKFKWDEADIFQTPLPINYLNGDKYNRFQPYHLTKELLDPIQKDLEKKALFDFQSGKASNTGEYIKTTSSKKTKVIRRHGEITDDLFKYLLSIGHHKDDISVEKSRVGGAIMDVVLKQGKSYDIFEIKTRNTAQKNIREALGQVLEYTLLDGNLPYNRIIIIGPAIMNTQEKEYFKRLKEIIKVDLQYWAYQSEAKSIQDKFILT